MRSSRLVTGVAALTLGLTAGWMARGWFGSIAPGAKDRRASGTAAPTAPVPRPLPLTHQAKPTSPAEPSSALRLVQKMIDANPDDGSPLETFTVDQFATYLERHQRTASSLLAVWNLTKDKAVLREAFENFPHDISVALQAIQHLDFPAEKKLSLAAQLEQDQPSNPLGSILAGAQLAQDGQTSEAIAKLREATKRGPLDFGTKPQLLAQQEALISIGKSPLEAQVRAVFSGDALANLLSHKLARPATNEMKSLMAAGNVDDAVNLASDMMAFARKVSAEPGGGMVTELVTLSIESGALRHLPPDVEIGDSGQTTADRLAQLKETKESISQAVDAVPWHLSHLDEPGLGLYLQILEQRGEREALKWAETYHGPAPQKTNPR